MSRSWKTVRVFISSTFRDMHGERDHLVRFVFPELKERCRQIRIRLIDVDLRWGVTEEDAQAGKVLDICLDEIDTCRPYFLGLLGFRYGYVPPGQDHSVTAQEIFHGVLRTDLPRQVPDLRKVIEGKLEGRILSEEQKNVLVRCYSWDGEKGKYLLRSDVSAEEAAILRSVFSSFSIYQKDRSYFFFRSEALTRQLAGNQEEDFFEKDPQKLIELKQNIRDAGLPVYEYNDLETFGRLVQEMLWSRIKAEADMAVAEKSWLEEEADFHELFMADRTRRFVGRRELLDRMHAFANSKGDPSLLLISGEPGSGKSALMSRFAEERVRVRPDGLSLSHFIGASPTSTSLRQMLRRFCAHLNHPAGSGEDLPQDIEKLIKLFPDLLTNAAKNQNILFIIDAVNQLERADDAHTMSWLPHNLPANVRFVISTLPGEAEQALLARRPLQEKISGLSRDEIKELVRSYLAEIRREFPNRNVETDFFKKIEKGNPLYILVALEELRVFGKFEQLPGRIQELPENVADLFDQVLQRIESDFHKPLIAECMSLIACGRHGMTAEELQILLKQHAPKIDRGVEPAKLPDLLWSRMVRSFSTYLFERSGVMDFFHGQLKEAVGKRYLQDSEIRQETHKRIAEYFERRWKEPYSRAIAELPHQRLKSSDDAGLTRTLQDLEFMESKCSAEMTYGLLADFDDVAKSKSVSTTTKDAIVPYALFGHKYAHVFFRCPELVWQQAMNEPDASVVAETARRLQEEGRGKTVWLEWVNKPQIQDPCLFTIPEEAEAITYSPSGDWIASGHMGGIARIWDASNGKLLQTLERRTSGFKAEVISVTFSSENQTLATATRDGWIDLWNAKTGEHLKTLENPGRIVEIAYLLKPNHLAVRLKDYTTRYLNTETGKPLAFLPQNKESEFSVAPSRNKLAVAFEEKIHLFDLEKEIELKAVAASRRLQPFVYSDAAEKVLTFMRYIGLTAELIDVRSPDTPAELVHPIQVASAAFSPDGKFAATGTDRITLWNAASGERVAEFQHGDLIKCAFSPCSTRAISATSSSIKVWDLKVNVVATKQSIFEVQDARDGMRAWTYVNKGSQILSGYSFSGAMVLWDANDGSQLKLFRKRGFPIFHLESSPDGFHVGIATGEEFQIWNVNDGTCREHSPVNTLSELNIRFLAFSPDTRFFAGATQEAYARSAEAQQPEGLGVGIWDVRNFERVMLFDNYTMPAQSMFSPDARFLLTTFNGISIWDIRSGKKIRDISTKTLDARFSADGRKILAGTSAYDFRTGDLVAQFPFNSSISFQDDSLCLSGDEMLEVCDREQQKVIAKSLDPAGRPFPAKYGNTFCLVGDDRFYVFRLNGYQWKVPVVTAMYLWRQDLSAWENSPTVKCEWCWQRCVSDQAVEAIHHISRDCNLRADDSPLLTLPDDAWNDSRLLIECRNCKKPLKLNPFVVDQRSI